MSSVWLVKFLQKLVIDEHNLVLSKNLIDYFCAASNNKEDAETPSMSPERLSCQAYNKGKIAEITTDEFSSEGLSITQCQLYCLTASSVFMGIVVRVDRNTV